MSFYNNPRIKGEIKKKVLDLLLGNLFQVTFFRTLDVVGTVKLSFFTDKKRFKRFSVMEGKFKNREASQSS